MGLIERIRRPDAGAIRKSAADQEEKGTCAFLGACKEGCQLTHAFNAARNLTDSEQVLQDSDSSLVAIGGNSAFNRCPNMCRYSDEIEHARGRVRIRIAAKVLALDLPR